VRVAADYRRNVQRIVDAGSVPYGSTLTIWASGAVSIDQLVRPHVVQALLYMAGAVAGFVAPATVAYGGLAMPARGGGTPSRQTLGLSLHW
jgi:hypothetical protein